MNKKYVVLMTVILIIISSLFGSCASGKKQSEQNTINVVLQADLTKISNNDKPTVMTQTIDVITKRLKNNGINEPVIQQQGESQILIQLPEGTDLEKVKTIINEKGFLEFRVAELNSQNQPVTLKDYLSQTQYTFIDAKEASSRLFTIGTTDNEGNSTYQTVAILLKENGALKMTDTNGEVVDKSTLFVYDSATSWIPARGNNGIELTGAYLADAQAFLDKSTKVAKPAVTIKWNAEGSTMFDEIAARIYNSGRFAGAYNIQYAIGIFLDDNLLSAPEILQASYGGSGEISGNFTQAQAQELANLMKSGALPVPVTIVEINGVKQ